MSLIKDIYIKHKDYFNTQKQIGKNISLKLYLRIFLIGVPYIGFMMFGIKLYTRTIVNKEDLIFITSILGVITYFSLFYRKRKSRADLLIIWNIIIVYVHSIMIFGTIILAINYLSIKSDYQSVMLPVLKWEESTGRSGDCTHATVQFNEQQNTLEFDGHIKASVEEVTELQAQVAVGIFGYAHIDSYTIDTK